MGVTLEWSTLSDVEKEGHFEYHKGVPGLLVLVLNFDLWSNKGLGFVAFCLLHFGTCLPQSMVHTTSPPRSKKIKIKMVGFIYLFIYIFYF